LLQKTICIFPHLNFNCYLQVWEQGIGNGENVNVLTIIATAIKWKWRCCSILPKDIKMIQTSTKTLSLEEFLILPETKPASEYIDGKVIKKPMPKGKHSAIQGEFVPAINGVVKVKRIARAFPELRCTYPAGSHSSSVYAGRSTVPDIAVFIWSRIPRDDNMGKLRIHSLLPQIGQFKFCLLSKVRQK
jgi:hypothetical protein